MTGPAHRTGDLDHIVIGCTDLDAGADWLAERLGVAPDPGGQHPRMGTHNRLLSLGPGAYLELIAINPEAPAPDHPRWFGLDGFSGPPRVIAWVRRGDSGEPPPGGHEWAPMSRGALNWMITLPAGGDPPGDGTAAVLIDWLGGPHPCDTLPDHGLRLNALRITRPDGDASAPPTDPRVTITAGPAALSAVIATPAGDEVTL